MSLRVIHYYLENRTAEKIEIRVSLLLKADRIYKFHTHFLGMGFNHGS
jgi:hypothetical protein